MKDLEGCPCCGDKECFTWVEYHRTGEILKRTVPVNAKYKIGDKVWVSISHNGDFREETELPTTALIDLWLDCVLISCCTYDEDENEHFYDFEHDMVCCVKESNLYKSKNEALNAMIKCLEVMKVE